MDGARASPGPACRASRDDPSGPFAHGADDAAPFAAAQRDPVGGDAAAAARLRASRRKRAQGLDHRHGAAAAAARRRRRAACPSWVVAVMLSSGDRRGGLGFYPRPPPTLTDIADSDRRVARGRGRGLFAVTRTGVVAISTRRRARSAVLQVAADLHRHRALHADLDRRAQEVDAGSASGTRRGTPPAGCAASRTPTPSRSAAGSVPRAPAPRGTSSCRGRSSGSSSSSPATRGRAR